MKNVFWFLIICMFVLVEGNFVTAASELNIQPFLSVERSSFISDKTRDTLRSRLDTGRLTRDKILEMIKSPQVAQLCYLHKFFSTAESGKPFTQNELRDTSFKEWISEHSEVFKMLAHSGPANRNTLSVFHQIWNTGNKKLNQVEISMALGAGLIADTFTPEECMAKFKFYQNSYNKSKCYPQSETLQPWEWAIVFRGKEMPEDISWAQQFIEKKNIKPEDAGVRFTGFVPYRKRNHKGVSIHAGAAFYDNKPITLKLYTEYGGVCGAVSKGAAGFLRAKGVPAWTIGQPGHCAFIWKHPNGHWMIGNNISGWNWSNGKTQIPWKGPIQILPSYDAFIHHQNAEESFLMLILSDCTQKIDHRELLLCEACKANPFNYPAWIRYLEITAKDANDQQKLALLKELAQAMPNEHNLIHHIAVKVLKIRENKINPYELYACFLGSDCSPAAEELFTRSCWNKLVTDCPEIKNIVKYKEGFIGKHLMVWLRKGRNAKWTPKMKRCSVKMMEGAILALEEKKKTREYYIKIYRSFLDIWNDEKLKLEGEKIIKYSKQLKN